jgi:hypothetical protein
MERKTWLRGLGGQVRWFTDTAAQAITSALLPLPGVRVESTGIP